MTGPLPPDDQLARLAAEVGELSRRLAAVQARLLALRGGAGAEPGGVGAPTGPGPSPGGAVPPAAAPAQPSGGPWVPPGYAEPPPYAQPPPGYGQPGPHGYPGVPPRWAPPAYPVPPRPAERPKPAQLLGPQLVAWTGGTVTLLGIVLLLVLAANRGWLQPGVRVIGGALLALALVGVAAWVYRRPGGRTGAVALAATGVAGLYLDVVAATALYDYLPVAGGLVMAVVVAGGGLALADRWRSEPLAAGAVVGAAVLAPVLTEAADPLLVALAVVLQLAAAPVVLRQRWPVLAAVAAAWPVLYGVLAVAWAVDHGQHPQTTAAVAAVLLAGVGLAVAGAATSRLPNVFCGVQLAAAALPVLGMATVLDRGPGAATAALVAVLLFVVAAPVAPVAQWPVPREVRAVVMVIGAVAAFEATMIALRGGAQSAVVLAEAVVLAVAAIAMHRRSVLLAATGFGAVGTVLAASRDAPLQALLTFPARPYVVGGQADTSALVTGAGVAALVLIAAVAILVAADRLDLLGGPADPLPGGTPAPAPDRATRELSVPLWVVGAGVVLYGAAGVLVALALLVTATRSGFLAGHVLVTVSWTVAALILLVRGIHQPALRVAGGALVIAAVAKLVLFDLSQLDGLARVVAFLGAGLVLLAAGTRYARLVAAARSEPPQSGPPQSGPAGSGTPQSGPPQSGPPPRTEPPGQSGASP